MGIYLNNYDITNFLTKWINKQTGKLWNSRSFNGLLQFRKLWKRKAGLWGGSFFTRGFLFPSTSALPRQQTWLPCVPRYLLGSMLDRRQRRPYHVPGRLASSHVWFQAWHTSIDQNTIDLKRREETMYSFHREWWRWSPSIVSTILLSFCRKRYSLGS